MDEWKVIKQEIIELNSNNFIEVSLKQPPELEIKLIGISKGWTRNDGTKLFKSNILLSLDKKDELIEILSKIDK